MPKSAATTAPCPFTVLIDKQEKHPYTFQNISSNADTKHLPFAVSTEPAHLQNLGDYTLRSDSLAPWDQPQIMIERKSKTDLFGSIKDRENFEWRLGRLDTEVEFAAVVVEAEWSEIFDSPPDFTEFSPTSVHRTIQAWQQRFQRVHWAFYPGREAAETATFWYLFRFHENLENAKLDRDRKRTNYQTYLEGMQSFRKRRPIADCPHPKIHAVGTIRDYWLRGWLDGERLAKDKPLDALEYPLVYLAKNVQ